MNELTWALAEVCRAHLLDEKWLLAPSLRVGHQWVETLTRAGHASCNLNVKTLKALAMTLAKPEMERQGLRLVPARGAELLLDQIFRRLREGFDYLASLRTSASLIQVLHRSLDDLRRAGLDAAQISPRKFEASAKGRELIQLFQEYTAALRANQWVDYADVLRLGVDRLQKDPRALGSDVLILIPADFDPSALEQKLLEALPPGQRRSLPVDESVADQVIKDGTAQVFRAIGEVNEVREVLRRILTAGQPFDRVEVIHTDSATYVPLLYELFARFAEEDVGNEKLPVTFAEGISTRYSRPGRALALWLEWVRQDFPQTLLLRLIQDGLLNLPEREEVIRPSALAAVLRSLGIGFGAERYRMVLEEQLAALQNADAITRTEDGEEIDHSAAMSRKRRGLEALRELVVSLLRAAPRIDADPPTILQAALLFLKESARSATELDNYARIKLEEDIAGLLQRLAVGDVTTSIDVGEWLRALPHEARVLGSGPRPGALHVSALHSGGHSGRPFTYVVGLDDGRFPGAGLQDPLLLDTERQKLSDRLGTSAKRVQDNLRRMSQLLARLRGEVTLSYSCWNLLEDRDQFPSSAVLGAFRILSGNRAGDQSDLLGWLPPSASFAPDAADKCLDEAEWWLWRLCGPEVVDQAEELVARRFPHLGRGREAGRQRFGAEITAYDGFVPDAGADHDPTSANGPVMTSGKLETLGRCPLAYFFRYVLGLEPLDEIDIDPSRWLDSPTLGALLHEVFEQFMRELISQGTSPAFERDWPRLQELLNVQVERYRRLSPIPNENAFRRQYRQLVDTVRIFLRDEERHLRESDSAPIYLEAFIGNSRIAPRSPLDSLEPATIDLAENLRIRVAGKIDRIDRAGSGETLYAIWDYKTGSPSRYSQADPFQRGRVIQNVLYVELLTERLKLIDPSARLESFGYFFPGERGQGKRMRWPPDVLTRGRIVLQQLCEVSSHGTFLPTDKEEDCRFCDFASICGQVARVTKASERKLETALHPSLQPLKELRTHG